MTVIVTGPAEDSGWPSPPPSPPPVTTSSASRTPAEGLPYDTVAADPAVAAGLIARHRPRILVLNAGVVPTMGPVDRLSWAEFERNWQVDTRHVFEWTGAALRLPLEPGSVVVAMSSGAALRGSPVSGGYAGAGQPDGIEQRSRRTRGLVPLPDDLVAADDRPWRSPSGRASGWPSSPRCSTCRPGDAQS